MSYSNSLSDDLGMSIRSHNRGRTDSQSRSALIALEALREGMLTLGPGDGYSHPPNEPIVEWDCVLNGGCYGEQVSSAFIKEPALYQARL